MTLIIIQWKSWESKYIQISVKAKLSTRFRASITKRKSIMWWTNEKLFILVMWAQFEDPVHSGNVYSTLDVIVAHGDDYPEWTYSGIDVVLYLISSSTDTDWYEYKLVWFTRYIRWFTLGYKIFIWL